MKKYYELTQGLQKNYIDPKTGEITDFQGKVVYIQSEEQRLKNKDYFKKLNGIEEKYKILNEEFKEYGNFIWNVYNMNQTLLPSIYPSNLTRLMFISTFLGYNSYLMFNKRTVMTKEKMMYLLNLSDRQFRYFCDDMVKNNIFEFKDDKIYINEDLFGRGHLSESSIIKFLQEDKFVTRLYINGVRDLYLKATPRSHKRLSYLFRILPYVNRQYNIVCFNPLEEDLHKIQPMSLGQCCELLGFDDHNADNLFKYFFDPEFVINGETKCAMNYVANKRLNKAGYSMFINPMVYYAGDKWNEVAVLGAF